MPQQSLGRNVYDAARRTNNLTGFSNDEIILIVETYDVNSFEHLEGFEVFEANDR